MKLAPSKSTLLLYLAFIGILIVNISFWHHAKKVRAEWSNVPVSPQPFVAAFAGLGDEGTSYRLYGYFLQNLGNVGGRYTSLRDYDYDHLEKWFFLSRRLDPRSDFVPFMAAYYFGGVEDRPEKTANVVNYLREVGKDPYPEKWRWLAQAVYLARFRELDMSKALTLSYELANLPAKKAIWAEQMPAFIKLKMGDKEAAYEIMFNILKTEQDKIHPNEVNAMLDFICTRTLTKEQAAENQLCKDFK